MAIVPWIVAGVLGVVFGGYGMTQVVMGYHWLFFRSLLADGQYFFFFLLTYPAGAVAALTTVVTLATRKSNPQMSITSSLIGGSITVVPAVLYSFTCSMNGLQNHGTLLVMVESVALLFLPIYVVGGALIVSGVIRNRRLKSSPAS
jgi:hypothetical protein